MLGNGLYFLFFQIKNIAINKMSDYPVFQFRSVKEKIDDKKYVIDTKISIKCELNNEPDIQCELKNQEKMGFDINSLLLFMNNKVENELKEEIQIDNMDKFLIVIIFLIYLLLQRIKDERIRKETDILREEKKELKERLREEEIKKKERLKEDIQSNNKKIRYPLPPSTISYNKWEEHYTDSGIAYYWNPETDESVWKNSIINIQQTILSRNLKSVINEDENILLNNEKEIKPKLDLQSLKKELDNIKKSDNKVVNKVNKEVNNKINKEVENALIIQNNILEHLKLIISGNTNMIFTNLIYIITELMKFVETIDTKDFDKKSLIIETIKQFLKSQNLNSSETDTILDTICPELIDILLLVDKRKIVIRKKLNCFFPWCA